MTNKISGFIIFIVAIPFLSIAQTNNAAINKNIAAFNASIQSSNYIEASANLRLIKKQVDSLIGNQIAEAFPKAIDNWVIAPEIEKADVPMPGGGPMSPSFGNDNEIKVTKFYKDKNEKQPSPENSLSGNKDINSSDQDKHGDMHAPVPMSMHPGEMKKMLFVIVSNSAMELSSFLMLYSNPQIQGNVNGFSVKTAKIKNYRAIIQQNSSMKTYEVSIIVGASIVKVTGQSLEDNTLIDKLCNAIDFNKIKSYLGE